MTKFTTRCLIVVCTLLAFSCKKEDEPSTESLEKEVVSNYAAIVYASYEDSYNTAVTLQQKINAFVAAPSAAGLEECKAAWKAARIPYGQTEAYRFYGGPIDDANGPEGLINSWPLDEVYIDYVKDMPDAGIINNIKIEITKAKLDSLNQAGGDTDEQSEVNVATGYHAIEFLLWGQDFNANGPGDRPYTDYVTGGTAKNQARRGQYLKVIAELLVEDLAYVKDLWAEDGAYRKKFTSQMTVKTALSDVFTGLSELSNDELAGERMLVAISEEDPTKRQEHEHSCFSDNTHIDIQMNFKGVKNVYYGTYTRVDGTVVKGRSIAEVLEKQDKERASALDATFTTTETKILAIPAPFDQAIINNVDKIQAAAASLKTLSEELLDGAFALGIN
ncbi:imelysin family protein [Cytophagaceae bacterium YF14B1]|uniref:Imelysin family protein n=1 Tax=Xanthocytophaga flava TaxID=3048013 RepID=A0AAE3QQI1_9BACT|nr:imelysin family protein [Xanthocytophaga flavus]MDJ1483627.1 imelysin family protein [Xanthocytophaga flavus]